jgi:hypothetical protein
MNHSTSKDSEIGSDGRPSKPVNTLVDLEVKAYRLRERLVAKCLTHTPGEARWLEKQIQKLVQIYAEGRILLRGDRSDRIRQNHEAQGLRRTPEIGATDERE